MKVSPIVAIVMALISLSLPACNRTHAEEQEHQEHQKIVATSPLAKDVVITQQYVCQIRSQRNIPIRALQEGYLEPISVKEGQAVKEGDVLFQVLPTLYRARLDAEQAKARLAKVKYENTKRLYEYPKPVVSDQEVLMAQAELDEANAKAKLAEAELNFTTVKAPFNGIIDRLQEQQGSLVKKEDILTTLSDNSVMWVYFNVPETRYFEYKAQEGKRTEISRLELVDSRIELRLADSSKFNHEAGNTVTVEGKFNNETGNIAFRADFPNPEGLLRHGQTGTVLIHRTIKNALVIPQRTTFEILAKRYVYVIDKDGVVHQREIIVQHELEDIFVIQNGLSPGDKIVLEGARQLRGREGQKVEFEFRKPEEALANQKQHAE